MKDTCLSYFTFFLVLALVSCGDGEDNGAARREATDTTANRAGVRVTQAQFTENTMQLGRLEEKTFPVRVEATGMIDVPPENRAMVSSFADGYVKQTPLLIGDSVREGQFLASLENPDFVQIQQDYLDAVEQMKYLQSEYERQKTLLAENITSEKNFLKAESEYQRNRSRYNALRKKLQMLNLNPQAVENGQISSTIRLYAPISGSITEMKINKGMYVSAADELMQIINPDHLHIELDVFEKDVMKLKKGQDIRLTISEARRDTLMGEVHLVGASINEEKRTVKVHGHFKDESKLHLATGMFVQAEIITDTTRAPALPSESIVNLDETAYVLVLQSQNDSSYAFQRREVRPGPTFGGFTEISNAADFKSTDQFLVEGAFPLITEE